MILLTIYNDNYLWKNFYYNLFFYSCPTPLLLFIVFFLSFFLCFFLFFVSILFSFSPFFSLIILLFSLYFYAFPPRYSVFQSVSRTFLIYLYIFLFDFSSFSYISLFSYSFYIYISVYDYIYNKIPNIIYK